jgi:hypothetical protein
LTHSYNLCPATLDSTIRHCSPGPSHSQLGTRCPGKATGRQGTLTLYAAMTFPGLLSADQSSPHLQPRTGVSHKRLPTKLPIQFLPGAVPYVAHSIDGHRPFCGPCHPGPSGESVSLIPPSATRHVDTAAYSYVHPRPLLRRPPPPRPVSLASISCPRRCRIPPYMARTLSANTIPLACCD